MPEFGSWGSGHVYLGPVDHSQVENVDRLVTWLHQLREEGDYLSRVDSWWQPLVSFAQEKRNLTSWRLLGERGEFGRVLSDFLFSQEGTKYQRNFRWDGELVCGRPAPPIKVRLVLH